MPNIYHMAKPESILELTDNVVQRDIEAEQKLHNAYDEEAARLQSQRHTGDIRIGPERKEHDLEDTYSTFSEFGKRNDFILEFAAEIVPREMGTSIGASGDFSANNDMDVSNNTVLCN